MQVFPQISQISAAICVKDGSHADYADVNLRNLRETKNTDARKFTLFSQRPQRPPQRREKLKQSLNL
jgi:hypothetical protein